MKNRPAMKWPLAAVMCLYISLSGCATFGNGIASQSARWAPAKGDWALGVPIYPGASLFEIAVEKGKVIYLALVTNDRPEKVKDFYSSSFGKASSEWKSDLLLDGLHYWRGAPSPDPYGSFGAPTMDVRVSAMRFKSRKAPQARTMIAIQDRAKGKNGAMD
ncbi:MAG: hypothetical protein OEZ04_03805 [Nitrospinota bacterium]|nr:hypothetical protein [Nitrospinota bacterium]